MKRAKKFVQKIIILIIIMMCGTSVYSQSVNIVPTNTTQTDYVNAYKMVMKSADNDYHSTSANFDATLFPLWGEHTVYKCRIFYAAR